MDEQQSAPNMPEPAAADQQPAGVPPIPPVEPKIRGKIFIIIGAVLALLLAGAYAALAAYNSPERIWERSLKAKSASPIYSSAFKFSYVDNGQLSGPLAEDPTVGMFEDLKFSMEGTAYNDETNVDDPDLSSDFTYSFGSGDISISSKARLIFKDKDFYINLGKNPFASAIMAALSPGEPAEWLKFDDESLKELNEGQAGKPVPEADAEKLRQEISAIADKYETKVLIMDRFIDRQEIHGVKTLHYSNKLNRAEAKAMLHELGGVIVKEWVLQEVIKQEEADMAARTLNRVMDDFLERSQGRVFETWIGARDYQLYKIKGEFTVPSVAALISFAGDQVVLLGGQEDPEKIADILLKGLKYEAVMSFELETYDLGKKQEVTVPASFVDVAKNLKEMEASAPAKPSP